MATARHLHGSEVKKRPIRHVIVVSDIHAGASAAIMPPEFVTLEGQTVRANPLQRWYWDVWRELCDEWVPAVTRGEPFALVVNGDLVEGPTHHRTTEVVSLEWGDHMDLAVEVLKPLSDAAAATFITEGTSCHVENVEHGIARRLKAIGPNGTPAAWKRLDLTICGHRCIFQHHISTSARTWTEATALGAALANEQLEAARAGERPPSLLASAHRHRPGMYQTSSGLSLVTGAWQGLTRHGRKVVPSARCWPSAAHVEFDGPDSMPRGREFTRCPPAGPSITL